MHDIEIVLQDDITASVVIKELEGGSNSVGNVNDALIEDSKNEMNSKGQPSVQQAAAITKAPLIAAANKAKNGLNNTLARINSGTTPRRDTTKTLSGTSKGELQIDTFSPLSGEQDDEHGGEAPTQCSRRLVEYFVVVSSVPKFIARRDRVESSDGATDKKRQETPEVLETSTQKLTSNNLVYEDGQNIGQILPPPLSTTSGGKQTPRMAARVDKRRGHLQESFRPGESVLPASSLPAQNVRESDGDGKDKSGMSFSSKDNAIHRTSSDKSIQRGGAKIKGNLFPSMAEQKKMFSEQKKKLGLQASGLQHQLESKMKSISIGRSFSGDSEKQPPQKHESSDDSSSSSFSIEDASSEIISPPLAFQPSSPTVQTRCMSPPQPPPKQQREGGASENIRINNSVFASPSRDYNNDIDDCILEPVITAQYPPMDRPDQPLNPMLTHFCFPQGVEEIVPLHEYKMPKIHHFVLTDSKGGKLYGTCLTVYEEFSTGKHVDTCDDVSVASTREEDQERNYVECSINEPPTVRRHRRRSRNHKYYAPRVLCLLSTWPYLSAFRTYLTQLYRLATTTTLMVAPLERYIINICEEVPAPPPGSFEVQLNILQTNIRIWAPPADQPIPYVSVNYGVLFECLDISNVLFAWNTLACERKILLVSSQVSLLTVCAEILCSMIFPMRWSHLYIPVLPRFLTQILDAPMPYLCGISRENFPLAVGDICDETVVVDLDRNLITMGTQTPDLPILPQRRKLKLEAALEKHAGHVFWKARGLTKASVEAIRLSGDENAIEEMLGKANSVWDEQLCAIDEAYYLAHSPDSMSILYDKDTLPARSRWDAVQEAFLRFYVAMLKDYRKYLPTTTEHNSWRASLNDATHPKFLADEFIASQRLEFRPFIEELVMTQQFDDFVTRRIYNKGKAPDVTFFDESIDAKKNRSKLRIKKTETPFLHSANAHRIMKRIDAIEPNRNDLPTGDVGEYIYPTWPESFDETLFGSARPIPKIITAEFDRRAALSTMFNENRGTEESRLSGCCNPSPEATAFVLFFVMYNQVVGRDWESFRRKHGNMLDEGFNLDVPTNDVATLSEPWKPAINPPWMAGESFQSLHSNLRPQEKNETVVDERNEVSAYNACIPDCDNFCNEKVLDPSSYIGMPWASSSAILETESTKSPINEQFENEYVKARSVAKAQVDLGVNTLKMMRLRKLASEAITYKSLIEACGRCAIPHRATQLLEMMTQDGLIIDSEVYYCFMKAFSHGETETTLSSNHADTLSEVSTSAPSAVSGISSSEIHRRSSYDSNATLGSKLTAHTSRFLGEINHAMTSSLEDNKRAFKSARSKRMSRLLKKTLTKEKDVIVTKAVRTHLDLSNCLLEDLYPGLSIDTGSDTCPKCSCVLAQDEIIMGWTPCEIKDFSTTCPSCKHRFVPKFSISCKSVTFEGSQGRGTTLFVDYLSPWILLRKIKNMITPSSSLLGNNATQMPCINGNEAYETPQGIQAIIDPSFREGIDINATLWWNIIVTFKRFKIPYTFLLQGSYPDQELIMPSLDDM